MDKALHVLAALAGAYFLIFMGGSWVFTPEIGAQNLQMIYMEGAARAIRKSVIWVPCFCAWAVLPVMAFGKSARFSLCFGFSYRHNGGYAGACRSGA